MIPRRLGSGCRSRAWTATNGTVLAFSNAYCGELAAQGRWSSTGTGTYTLGNANGAVQGRTNNSVGSVPSPGGPYHFAIDSGTGSCGAVFTRRRCRQSIG